MHLSFNRVKARLGNVELAGRDHTFTMQLLDTLEAQVSVAPLGLGLSESFLGCLEVGLSLGQRQPGLALIEADQQLASLDLVPEINQDLLDRAGRLIADRHLFPATQGTDHLNRTLDLQ